MKQETSNPSSGNAFFDFFFIKTVPAVIWIFLILFFGFISYKSIIKESLPDLEIPEFQITTIWEGATPEMMEKEVTQKIEKELRGLKGIKKIYSSSTEESSTIAVTFSAQSKLSESSQLIQKQVGIAQGNLPENAEAPKIEASSVNDIPIATVALLGKADYIEKENLIRELKRKFEFIPGIKKINIIGLKKKAVSILLKPERLKSFSIPATLARQRIMDHGFDASWGRFENTQMNFSLKMNGAYTNLDELKDLLITRLDGGTLIRLHDIANINIGYLREKTLSTMSVEGNEFVPVVALDIMKGAGHDTMTLVKQIKRVMQDYSQSSFWPQNVQWQLTGNQAESIRTELERGFSNGWQAMLGVFIVLLVLLNWREALIAAISVPLTLIASLVILWSIGYSFNMLVIVGMILALGLLVDDFILIMEGMHESVFIKQLDFVTAVKRTIKTYAIPSFSGSITTILVFIPLAFIEGTDGKFIRVIPVTAAICLVISYIISIAITPAMSRVFLGSATKKYQPATIDRLSHQAEQSLSGWIGRNVVANRKQALEWIFGAFGLFVLSLLLASIMRETLYPKEDGRTLGILVQLSEDSSLKKTDALAEKLGNILQKKNYLEHVIRISGGKSSYSLSSFHDYLGKTEAKNLIGFNCFLKPRNKRDKLAYEYVPQIRKELETFLKNEPGAQIFINPQTGGSSEEDPIQINITGDDMMQLRNIAGQVKRLLAVIPGVVDIRDNTGTNRLEMRFRPMPEAMDHYKVTRNELASQMVAYMENEKIAKFRQSGTRDDLDIRLGTKWFNKNDSFVSPADWKNLAQLCIINEDGLSIPIWSLAEPEMVAANRQIFHNMGHRSVTILARLDGIYASEVIKKIRPELEKMKRSWSDKYSYFFAGEEEKNTTYKNLLMAFCIAIVLVYALLALLFDSLIYPGIILSTVIFAITGVLIGFSLADIPFSFSASIGIVALVGIVVNDAIIVVETIRNHRKSGLSIIESARHGAADRLRPILSTTITNFAGLAPLALSDPGWAPLCQAIIFGEITATIGAIILIPALFVLFTKGNNLWKEDSM